MSEPDRKYDPEREIDKSWFVSPSTLRNNWFDWRGRNHAEYMRFGDMRTTHSDGQAEAGFPDLLVCASTGRLDVTARGKQPGPNLQRGRMIADYLAARPTEGCPCQSLIEGD